MDKLISQERTIRDLCDIKDMLVAAGDPFLASIMIRAISCVENQEVVEAVTVSEENGWDMDYWTVDSNGIAIPKALAE